MHTDPLPFIILTAASICIYRAFGNLVPGRTRQVLLIALDIILLRKLLPGSGAFFPWLMGHLLVLAYLAFAVHRTSGRTRKATTFASVLYIVAVMLVFKYPTYTLMLCLGHRIVPDMSVINWVGLSYLSFRALDLIVTVNAGRIERLEPFTIANYILFYPGFLTGPINRLLPFTVDQGKTIKPLTFVRLRNNLLRIALGFVKILFLAEVLRNASILTPEISEAPDVRIRFVVFLFGLYAYLLYIYLDFSGYCDVAIALADFFEIRLPENFRYPFLATSPQDFWNRWHISLSHWCRDHIFFPLMKVLVRRLPGTPTIASSGISIFITFLFVGAWHGDALNWVLYGCYHGAGLAVCMLYGHAMNTRCPGLFEKLQSNIAYRAVCVVLTFNYVACGLILVLPLHAVGDLLRAVTF